MQVGVPGNDIHPSTISCILLSLFKCLGQLIMPSRAPTNRQLLGELVPKYCFPTMAQTTRRQFEKQCTKVNRISYKNTPLIYLLTLTSNRFLLLHVNSI
ncbi:hypothetical protein I7I48_03372 [Histoplasma ohiense]|nr:hypothetical protein I7I48_03372 [Histoplasma ohiense (nom. inval.)]